MDTKSKQSRYGLGRFMRDDIRALADTTPQHAALPELSKTGGMPAAHGRGDWKPAPESTGAGVASPLTETDYSRREYYPEGVRSSDGLFFIPAIKTIIMRDANSNEVAMHFAAPSDQGGGL